MSSIVKVIHQCEERFGLRVGGPLTHNSSAHIFLVTRGNEDLVLKIAMTERDMSREILALTAFAGRGAIDVKDSAEELSALLLQRAKPGYPLSTITDDIHATEIFCSVFQRLHSIPVTGTHESIQSHCSALTHYQEKKVARGPLPISWVTRATDYLDILVASTDHPVLLHGDLHHANILRHQDEWIVIDPKGIIGDPHFDVIQYLLNYPNRGGDPQRVLTRRMAIMTERLALDALRIAMWGVVKGMLDACWALDEGTSWHQGLETAERFGRELAQSGHS